MMGARFSHLFFMRPTQANDPALYVGAMMRAIASDKSIVTAIVTNNTDRDLTLDAKASAWRHEGDLDILSPSRDICVGPEAFVLAPQATQIVRFGVTTHDALRERAYQVVFTSRQGGELAALPVFVTPVGARASLRACIARSGRDARLMLANVGCAHAHIREVGARADAPTPFYLLAGAQIELPLVSSVEDMRIDATDVYGAQLEPVAFLAADDALAG